MINCYLCWSKLVRAFFEKITNFFFGYIRHRQKLLLIQNKKKNEKIKIKTHISLPKIPIKKIKKREKYHQPTSSSSLYHFSLLTKFTRIQNFAELRK